MSGVKVFLQKSATQKRAYSLLTKVIEKYQLQSIDELAEIRAEVTPMMQGSPSKQRLHLVKAYIEALIKFSTESNKNAETLKKVTDLIRAMVVELITAINNSNFKIRKLSEEIFLRVSYLLSLFDASA